MDIFSLICLTGNYRCLQKKIATVMVATGHIAAAAQVDPLYSRGGVNVYPM